MNASPAGHVPVLLAAVLRTLDPQPGQTVLDCTVGLGGHAAELLRRVGPAGRLIGLDVDPLNLDLARQRLADTGLAFQLERCNFAEWVAADPPPPPVDLLLADLGVSSTQLDQGERGLSFLHDGPLDMRLDDRRSQTAADLVNGLPEPKLADVIFEYGQEHASRRIARAICQARRAGRLRRTGELADVVSRALGVAPGAWRSSRIHPATRTFQALRIAVNDELGVLERLLAALPTVLAPGGRAAIISFHSLEDGLVKRAFKAHAEAGRLEILTRKPLEADDDEVRTNPRSRSAKLRVARRPAPASAVV